MPTKVAYDSMRWSGTHGTEEDSTHKPQSSRDPWPWFLKASLAEWPLWDRKQLEERPTESCKSQRLHCYLTFSRAKKATLCFGFSFATCSVTHKPGVCEHTHHPRTLPRRHCLLLPPRHPSTPTTPSRRTLRGAAERGWRPAGVSRFPSLTHFSLSSFLFLSSSVVVPARPLLFNSILLFLKHSGCYSEMLCLHRRDTPRALHAV